MKFINLERKGSFNNDNILINIADKRYKLIQYL